MNTHSSGLLRFVVLLALLVLMPAGCGGPDAERQPPRAEPAGRGLETSTAAAGEGERRSPGAVETPPAGRETAEEGAQAAADPVVPEPTVESPGPFLPPWWHAEPIVRRGRLYACAVAEATDLSAANRAAVATGQNALRAALVERGVTDVETLLAASRTEAAAADLAAPDLWRSFVEVSVAYAGNP